MEDQKADPRHIARAVALQHLFNKRLEGRNPFPDDLLLEILETEDFNEIIKDKLVAGVGQYMSIIDPVIKELAPAWPLDQIAPVDLTILRMGVFEAFIEQDTPARVVINECIELAKQFGGPNSGAFVNGVLGTLLNEEEIKERLLNEVGKTGHNTTE